MSNTKGIKNSAGKMQWSLLDLRAIKEAVAILTWATFVYEPENWRKVPNAKDEYYSALMRHLTSWKLGEMWDESGFHHLGHVICNAMFLLAFELAEERIGETEQRLRAALEALKPKESA